MKFKKQLSIADIKNGRGEEYWAIMYGYNEVIQLRRKPSKKLKKFIHSLNNLLEKAI